MKIITRQCANPECNNIFEPLVHNAIYCGDACRKLITNQKVLDKYYEKKEQKANMLSQKRVCAHTGCDTVLSIYNDETICESHKTARLIDRLSGWGWDLDSLNEEWSF